MFIVRVLMFFVVMVTIQLAIGQQFLCATGPQSLCARVAVVMAKRLGAWSAFHANFT